VIEIQDWGLIDYQEAWNRQKFIVKDIQENRNKNILIFCEHPTVITIGKNGSESNVIGSTKLLNDLGIKIIHNDRGGDATLHNPGQLVGYPIFNLQAYKTDLHWFLREIEQTIIDIVANYGINAQRVKGLTGVWVNGEKKICAMGFHCSRWVTSHGFALNVCNNLQEFEYIIPCGIKDKGVTSISEEIGTKIDLNDVKNISETFFKKRF